MQFKFPYNIEEFQKIRDINHLKQLISIENRVQGSQISYLIQTKKLKYIYAKCKYKNCQAKINYALRDNLFVMNRCETNHSHSAVGSKAKLYQQIQAQMFDLPLTVSMPTAKYLMRQKYKISQNCFYYLYKKIRNKKVSFSELISELMEKKYEVLTDPYEHGMNRLPDLMIIITPAMKENFKLYGQWLGFDFTYNIIQGTNDTGRHWGIGMFTGISASKKIVPFGLVVSNSQTKERYYQIFKSFSQIMNNMPRVIITDEDPAIISALKSLTDDRQFSGWHLLDCFHILRNVKKNLINKQLFSLYHRMIIERSQEKFEKIKDQCLEASDEAKDVQLLERFLIRGSSYCFAHVPPYLFGFMPSTAMNEKLHDLIKTILPTSKPFTVVVRKVLIYLEDLGVKCHSFQIENQRFELTVQCPQLKQVRYQVSKLIFSSITSQFYKLVFSNIHNQSHDRVQIEEKGDIYNVNKDEQNRWTCGCQYTQKTGIPCSHILKIALHRKQSISDYIHPRWKFNIEVSKMVAKKYEYQRKTRRRKK